MAERIRQTSRPEQWAERIRRNSVRAPSGCWIWLRKLDRSGYGRFQAFEAGVHRETGAHRASWIAFRGPIEGDLVIDHLCRVRRCVNPMHLDLVTVKVNTQRGHLKGRVGRKRSGPFGCSKHGDADGYIQQRRAGDRWVCRICARERMVRFKAKRQAAA